MASLLGFLDTFSEKDSVIDQMREMIKDDDDLMNLTRKTLVSKVKNIRLGKTNELWKLIREEQNKKKNVLQIEYTHGAVIRKEQNGSSVHYCTRKTDGKIFAAKRLMNDLYSNAQEEIKMISHIDPDNRVVPFYGHCEGREFRTIIMQLCGGDVDQLIWCKRSKEDIKPIDQENGYSLEVNFLDHFDIDTKDIMLQVVDAVEYLHTYKPHAIVHRGIKPSNFLLYKLNSGKTIVKIADFGLSRIARSDGSEESTEEACTCLFMGPEYFQAKDNQAKPTTETDIFSLGLTLFYIFTEGTHVYGETHNRRNFLQDKKLGFDEALPRGQLTGTGMDKLTDEHRITFCDMIRRMLVHEPSQRFTIHDVAKHPTFWEPKAKSDFYLNVYKTIENREKQEIQKMALEVYDKKLKMQSDEGEDKMSVSKEIIPEACMEKPKFTFDDSAPVYSLLKIMRHKKSHSGNLTPEENKVLGVATDEDGVVEINWDKFVNAFTGEVPQLLVHLYEKFRDENMSDKHLYYHAPEVNA